MTPCSFPLLRSKALVAAFLMSAELVGRGAAPKPPASSRFPTEAPIQIVETKSILRRGFLQVQFLLENQGSSLARYEYHIVWFDCDGMVVSAYPCGWLPGRLDPAQRMHLQEIAPSKDAVTFVLRLRPANIYGKLEPRH